MKSRYARQIQLPQFGEEGQEKLSQAKVLIVGCGGLGVPVVQILAGAGVGTLGLCDFDTVAIHNLHRQSIYTEAQVGQAKTEAAQAFVSAYNSEVKTVIHPALDGSTGKGIIQDYDLIVDCSDNFGTRYLLNDLCVNGNTPWVSGALGQYDSQISTFNWDGSGTYRCLFPEAPKNPTQCSTDGVWPALPAFAGSIMAWEIIDTLLGKPKYANQLRIDRLATGEHFSLQYSRSAQQKLITNSPLGSGISLTQLPSFSGDYSLIWIGSPLIPEELEQHDPILAFEDPIVGINKAHGSNIVLACTNGVLSKQYALSSRIQESLNTGEHLFFLTEIFG
ncbi:MAG: molybdopterin/thiamine biosynthesis adenylyltransferase [Sphingobacteriales bacterium]|jgi:molybdopterin/thiamine biosynthesis adenylyltransferase